MQGRHFNFFLGGQKFFKFSNATGLLKKWKKHHFICSNLTLFIVLFFLFSLFSLFFLFFLFFFLFFFFFFFLFPWGRRPPSPPNDASASVIPLLWLLKWIFLTKLRWFHVNVLKTSLAQNYTTHAIQNSFTNLQITSVQQTFLHFWTSHHTTNSFYPLICSCHSPTPFKISDRSFYFQAPALWNALPHHFRSHSHSSQSHSLLSLYLLNSTSSWKLTFFFIPILLSLASLYWTDPWNFDMVCLSFIIHSISFILDPFICSTRFNFMFVI